MLIAQAKKQSNIVEYILYMYQIEDIIRSFQFDLTAIDKAIISKYDQENIVKINIKKWYADLIGKIERQHIRKSGHLEELKQLSNELQQLHQQLLTTFQNEDYISIYEKAKPELRELVVKSSKQDLHNEIDVALHGMYGLLTLRLKQKEISTETENAMKKVSTFLAHLAHYYNQMKAGKLSIPKTKQN